MPINNNTTINDIQKVFNELYPFLWINFFYKGFIVEQPFGKPIRIDPERKLKELSDSLWIQPIDIGEKRTVLNVKDDFKNKLGLETQILRKTGKLWIDTLLTNNWTLEHQNEEGRLLQ